MALTEQQLESWGILVYTGLRSHKHHYMLYVGMENMVGCGMTRKIALKVIENHLSTKVWHHCLDVETRRGK